MEEDDLGPSFALVPDEWLVPAVERVLPIMVRYCCISSIAMGQENII